MGPKTHLLKFSRIFFLFSVQSCASLPLKQFLWFLPRSGRRIKNWKKISLLDVAPCSWTDGGLHLSCLYAKSKQFICFSTICHCLWIDMRKIDLPGYAEDVPVVHILYQSCCLIYVLEACNFPEPSLFLFPLEVPYCTVFFLNDSTVLSLNNFIGFQNVMLNAPCRNCRAISGREHSDTLPGSVVAVNAERANEFVDNNNLPILPQTLRNFDKTYYTCTSRSRYCNQCRVQKLLSVLTSISTITSYFYHIHDKPNSKIS